jgi:hypothetical protein
MNRKSTLISNPYIQATFKPVEFERFRRDKAKLEQRVVLTNLESLNAVFIRQDLPAPERLHKLNEIAISQMRSLLTDHHIKRLAS